MFTDFIVVPTDEAAEIEANARMRGIYPEVLTNLVAFHEEWVKENPEGKFLINLTCEGGPFAGKKVPSLYTGLNSALKKKELDKTFRLIRRTEKDTEGNETLSLFIAAL